MADYNSALCPFLDLKPPLIQKYTDVVAQIYPLRADPLRLQRFCDKFLKGTPKGNPFVEFAPATPWILMQVCKYTSMLSETANRPKADRCFAQNELSFGIPIKYWDKGSKPQPDQVAMVYPIVFVDNPISMEAGRQVYGWSKAGIEFDSIAPEFRPNEPRIVVGATFQSPEFQSFNTSLFRVLQKRPFLSGALSVAETYLAATAGCLDLMRGLISKYEPLTKETSWFDALEPMEGLESLGQTLSRLYGSSSARINQSMRRALGLVDSPTNTSPPMTIFTMKQVRDTQPKYACYRGLVRSQMEVTKVKDGGLLFDPLSGDPTGGIEISLRSGNSYIKQIMKLLARSDAEDASEHLEVSSLRPLMPFWTTVNLSYGLGDYQCWSSRHTPWQQEQQGENDSRPLVARRPNKASARIPYIKRGSGAAIDLSGPRFVSDAVLHIFPIPAERKVLQDLVDNYLNHLGKTNRATRKPYFHFEVKPRPARPNVYVTLLSYNKMWIGGERQNGDRVLSFAILVDYYRQHRLSASNQPVQALLPLYTFVGTDANFITEYEVYGRLTFKSRLTSPATTWLEEPGNAAGQRVLSLFTTLFPNSREGQAARELEFIKVYSEFGKRRLLRGDDSNKRLEGLGLNEYFTTRDGEKRVSWSIALKQVRNAIRCDRADYQSLVGIKRLFKFRKNEINVAPLKIAIRTNDNFPMLKILGLDRAGRLSKRKLFREFSVPDAFSVRGELREEQGKELWWRVAGHDVWKEA